MNIAVDKNQVSGTHEKSNAFKHEKMAKAGHVLKAVPLPFGDYCEITDEMQETIKRRGEKLKKQDLVGDIKICVDTKKNLSEVAMNICSKGHERFRDEVILAQKVGARMVALVEEEGIGSLDEVAAWKNPRLWNYCRKNKISYGNEEELTAFVRAGGAKPPVSGEVLEKAMRTMAEKYGVIWSFCKKSDTGKRIVEILSDSE